MTGITMGQTRNKSSESSTKIRIPSHVVKMAKEEMTAESISLAKEKALGGLIPRLSKRKAGYDTSETSNPGERAAKRHRTVKSEKDSDDEKPLCIGQIRLKLRRTPIVHIQRTASGYKVTIERPFQVLVLRHRWPACA